MMRWATLLLSLIIAAGAVGAGPVQPHALAQGSSPTSTPVPTASPARPNQGPNQGPDCLRVLADVTVPDGTQVQPGQEFEKIWQVLNCGTTTWDGYRAVRTSGTFGPSAFDVPLTPPGATVDLSVRLQAPRTAGRHRALYQLAGPNGPFLFQFSVEVVIDELDVACSAAAAPDGGTNRLPDAATLLLSAADLGANWCRLESDPSDEKASYRNASDFPSPRLATLVVSLRPSAEDADALVRFMVSGDLSELTESSNPAIGDGSATRAVFVPRDGRPASVVFVFRVATAVIFVGVSGSPSEVAALDAQARGFAVRQEARVRAALGLAPPQQPSTAPAQVPR